MEAKRRAEVKESLHSYLNWKEGKPMSYNWYFAPQLKAKEINEVLEEVWNERRRRGP